MFDITLENIKEKRDAIKASDLWIASRTQRKS